MISTPSKNDLLASLGVFVIAMPLGLGIALASGVAIQSAIIAAIVGGIVVGAFSGAPLAVTGPAAGLTVLVFDIVKTQGVAGLAMATLACGLFQLFFGTMRLGGYFKYLPHSILDGMIAAIGGMIAIGQCFVVAGKGIPSGFVHSLELFPTLLKDTFLGSGNTMQPILGVAVAGITIVSQLAWEKYAKRYSFIPGAVFALVVATFASLSLTLPRVNLEISQASLLNSAGRPSIEWGETMMHAIASGLLLAIVGGIESLATASGLGLYARKMRGTDLPLDLNKELRAQGIGNLVSSLLGGIPVTAVIVRSAANVQFGATSRWSTILHGIWILIAVMLLGPILNLIPLSALAAVLILTGLRLIKIKSLMDYFRQGYEHGLTYLVTFGAILASSLLKGIFAGVAVTLILALVNRFVSAQQSGELGEA